MAYGAIGDRTSACFRRAGTTVSLAAAAVP
jgi:hypothetical protein